MYAARYQNVILFMTMISTLSFISQAKAVQDAADASVAGLRKTVNENKVATIAALSDASKANVKARDVIVATVKEVAAQMEAVLECNAERKLYVLHARHNTPTHLHRTCIDPN